MARFEISSLSRGPLVTRSLHCISPTHASPRNSFPPSFHPSFEIQPYPLRPPPSLSLVRPIRVTGRGGSTSRPNRLAISPPLAIIILVHGKLSRCAPLFRRLGHFRESNENACIRERKKIVSNKLIIFVRMPKDSALWNEESVAHNIIKFSYSTSKIPSNDGEINIFKRNRIKEISSSAKVYTSRNNWSRKCGSLLLWWKGTSTPTPRTRL